MGLSEAMLFAFAATIICAFAIAEKIIDIIIFNYYNIFKLIYLF